MSTRRRLPADDGWCELGHDIKYVAALSIVILADSGHPLPPRCETPLVTPPLPRSRHLLASTPNPSTPLHPLPRIDTTHIKPQRHPSYFHFLTRSISRPPLTPTPRACPPLHETRKRPFLRLLITRGLIGAGRALISGLGSE